MTGQLSSLAVAAWHRSAITVDRLLGLQRHSIRNAALAAAAAAEQVAQRRHIEQSLRYLHLAHGDAPSAA
ncbi:MAG TPA: hypothetical protein VG708_12950 [Mycobacteriales bacterium]|jgi:hypothetical protein|nr:hypothetical protein [Mycobacteriales bacterium]